MPRDYKLYLEDILEAIQKIEIYTQNLEYSEFREDSLRVDAVLHNLMIISEAVKQIPEDLRGKYSFVEWRKISGFRDIVAHQYFGVSLEIVWDIVQNKLPGLRDQASQILEQ